MGRRERKRCAKINLRSKWDEQKKKKRPTELQETSLTYQHVFPSRESQVPSVRSARKFPKISVTYPRDEHLPLAVRATWNNRVSGNNSWLLIIISTGICLVLVTCGPWYCCTCCLYEYVCWYVPRPHSSAGKARCKARLKVCVLETKPFFFLPVDIRAFQHNQCPCRFFTADS